MASAASSREGTMLKKDQHGKIFIGGLNSQTNEKALEAAFGKCGPMMEVNLLKHRGTNKSRGFAFITFGRHEDAEAPTKAMNGKFLDGKAIKVERANNPSFASGGRQWPPLPSTNRDRPRVLRSGRRGSGEKRQSPLRGGHLDDGGYPLHLNMRPSMRPYQAKRNPSSRSRSASPKRSSSSDAGRDNSEMGRQGPVSWGRKKYEDPPRREPVSSRRKYYMSPRDGGYSTKDSYSRRDDRSSRNWKNYVAQPRDYRVCNHSRSQDEHSSRRHSDHDGCGVSLDRNYAEHTRGGGSYRDSYASYGNSHGIPPARRPPLTYDGRGCYDENYTRDRYGERHENYSSSQSDTSLSGREHGGR